MATAAENDPSPSQTSNPEPRAGKGASIPSDANANDGAPGGRLSAYLRALRPHQWVKNLLVLLPLMLAHKLSDGHRVLAGVYAFCAFSLCASAIYIINDLLDLQSDRKHRSRRLRPFAAGQVAIPAGLMMCAALLLGGFGISLALPWRFTALLGLYLILTTLYSLWLKQWLLLDVILLAVFYTLRIIAGATAVEVRLTMWLLAFSMFFFLSLAFLKRSSELIQVDENSNEQSDDKIARRNYSPADVGLMESLGSTSGYMAIMVFCLYLDSSMVKALYPNRAELLWMVPPVLLYWIARIWFIARRGGMHDDPIHFALRDRASYLTGAIIILILFAATLPGRWPFP